MKHHNPFNYMLPVESDEMFFGRQAIVDDIVDSLCSSQPKSFIVLGGRRSGKTSVLRAIERQLLNRDENRDMLAVLPVYIDLHFDSISSREAFFEAVLRELCQIVTERLAVEIQASSTILAGKEPVRGFETSLLDIMRSCSPFTVRVVILIDESESLFMHDWVHDLLGNLRALVSGRPAMRNTLEIVIAGSSRLLHEYHRQGSPLRNISERRTLSNLSRSEAAKLICEPPGIPVSSELIDSVWLETAGQPFLVQYIMHHLFEANLANATTDRVEQIVHSFYAVEQRTDFADWCEDLGQNGLAVYTQLIMRTDDEWVPHRLLLEAKIVEPLQLLRLIDSLCFHGIVEHGSPKCYRTAGRMFKRWFIDDILGQQPDPIIPTPLLPSERRYLEDQRTELDKRYTSLTKMIEALDVDIPRRTTTIEQQPLKEQRSAFESERDHIVDQLSKIERRLSGAM